MKMNSTLKRLSFGNTRHLFLSLGVMELGEGGIEMIRCDKCGAKIYEGENIHRLRLEAIVPDDLRKCPLLCNVCFGRIPEEYKSEYEDDFVIDGGFYPYAWD